MLMIKRYKNRKLYNLTDKGYVTLRELARRIQGGEEIFVTGAEANNNITSLTLAQVAMELLRSALEIREACPPAQSDETKAWTVTTLTGLIRQLKGLQAPAEQVS